MRNTLGFLFVGAMLASAAALVGCGGDTTATDPDMGGGQADLAMAVNPCTTGVICTKSTIADQSLDLFSTGQTTFDVVGADSYSGTVNLTLDRTSIDGLPGGADPSVGITLVPGTFQMTAGAKKTVTVKFNTATDAAAFTGMAIKIHVADSVDATKSFDVPFKLTVNPTLTITFTGDGTNTKHTWSTDNGTTTTFNVRQRPATATSGGTNFVFLNKGTGSHIVHGSGKIKHQDTNGTGTAANATYSVNYVTDVMNTGTDGFYCHTHGTGSSNPTGERFVTFIP